MVSENKQGFRGLYPTVTVTTGHDRPQMDDVELADTSDARADPLASFLLESSSPKSIFCVLLTFAFLVSAHLTAAFRVPFPIVPTEEVFTINRTTTSNWTSLDVTLRDILNKFRGSHIEWTADTLDPSDHHVGKVSFTPYSRSARRQKESHNVSVSMD
jgi:hypothetical protein